MARSLAQDKRHVVATILLNAIAGFVDLVGWVVFVGLYTANMTGNLVAIGRTATQGSATDLLERVLPVVGFFAGLLCAALWTQTRRRWWQPLAVEALLLAGLGAAPRPLPVWAAAFAAVAMGLQNATVTHAGPLSVRTTHVTGTISRLAESFAQWLRTRSRQARQRVWFFGGLLLAYLAGAVGGTFGLRELGQRAFLIPAAALALVGWFLTRRLRFWRTT
jgi:uncharacterized membrane protein YoaK (UPF0700 family)